MSASSLVTWWSLVAALAAAIVFFGSKNTRSLISTNVIQGNPYRQCLEDYVGMKQPSSEGHILCLWLQDVGLLHQSINWKQVGLGSLEDIHKLNNDQVEKQLGPVDSALWQSARLSVPSNQIGLAVFRENLLKRLPDEGASSSFATKATQYKTWGTAVGSCLFVVLCLFFAFRDFKLAVLQWLSSSRRAINTRVIFHWNEPCMVGNTVSFTVLFFHRWTGQPYPVSDADSISVNVRQGGSKIGAALEVGGESPSQVNQVKATFTVRKAGQYVINVNLGAAPISGSPFIKNFLPGPPDSSKTTRFHPTSLVVCTVDVPYQLILEPRDEYGNYCSLSLGNGIDQQQAPKGFSLDAYTVGTLTPVKPMVQWFWVEVMHRLLVNVTFDEEGIYNVRLKLQDTVINKAEFNMIALSRADAIQVEKSMKTRAQTYETKLLSINGEKWTKNKKVFCALSPKQMAVKEYFLGLFPKRLATFRLCPSTKFTFQGYSNKEEALTMTVEDGAQLEIEIACKEGHLMAASFAHYLRKNIGGSETFTDKQNFFYQEVYKYHQKKVHDKLVVRVERDKLLLSSMKATKNFTTSDWCRNFEISFVGEQGLDWGGLRREWIELLCVAMFDRKRSGMFTTFSDDDVQALVHPNPKTPPDIKAKHYEFAGKIVGKCLYESALGATYRQLVKARFTRSFLAQLIGLRVTYKYFEQDDPQLFLSKIKYIEGNDVADMDLTFSEDEYDERGQLLRTVELIPGGAKIPVNNENKFRYLDALAQHRLVNSVKEQVDAFLHGLNELIPDNLLSIFDENELELLVCGTSEYSVAQLKAHHVAVGSSSEFRKVLSWFWTAVTNFGPEELSRLLQFTTGSSQLPPGGLAELSPKLQIVASPSFGTLPTAHTCFNQLCLPDYENYEQFEKALLLAINEGSEGFGLV